MSEKSIVYVVTQYASQANRRVVKVLQLQEHFDRMTLVSEPGERLHDDTLVVRKPRNPTAVLKLLGWRRLRWALDQRLYFPSPVVLYVKAAIAELRERIRRDLAENHKVCVMTMTPPHDLAIVGLKLKRELLQVRWIVDWQDLWSYDEYYFANILPNKQDRLKKLEQEVLQGCDLNVVTNHAAKSILEKEYGVPPGKVVSISHPYDYEELGDLPPNGGPLQASVRIGFLGHLFKLPKVPGGRVVEAVEKARQRGIDVELHVFGDMQPVTSQAACGRDWMKVHPRVSHSESLKAVAKCDLLLLTLADLPNTRIIMHAKLSHYLIMNRPIIAMVPSDSLVANIVRETGTGYVISTDEDWGTGLISVLEGLSRNDTALTRNEIAIADYSWENISKRWVEHVA